MGSRFSSFKTSQENETEVDYDKVYQLRSQLFPDVIDDELLRLALKDRSPTQVFTDDTGFKIFVGSAIHAQNVPALRENGISYIVNMAAGDLHTSQDFYGVDFRCLMISASDLEVYDLSQHFTEVSEFIEEARAAKTGVLVHCMAGVSRSVTVTVSYLMKCQDMTLFEAAKQVHSHRLQAYPNIRFIQNLVELEKELKAERKRTKPS